MQTRTIEKPKSFDPKESDTYCIVTGHSRGLGQALTLALLHRGCHVMGISRQTLNPPGAADCEPDGKAWAKLAQTRIDLSDSRAVMDWLETGELARWLRGAGQVALINNAGQLGPVGLSGQADHRELVQAISLNVSAALLFSEAFMAASKHCPDRRVMHISSGAGRSAYAGWTTYCATKAALDHHARALAAEKHAGLRIGSVAPGVIDTDMQMQLRQTDPERFPMHQRFVDLKEQGGLSSSREAAQALADYLFSDMFGNETIADIRSFSR